MSAVKTQLIKHLKGGLDRSAKLQEEIDLLKAVEKSKNAALEKREKTAALVFKAMEERRSACQIS